MVAIWIVTLILAHLGNHTAISLAEWFRQHVVATVLMLIFLA